MLGKKWPYAWFSPNIFRSNFRFRPDGVARAYLMICCGIVSCRLLVVTSCHTLKGSRFESRWLVFFELNSSILLAQYLFNLMTGETARYIDGSQCYHCGSSQGRSGTIDGIGIGEVAFFWRRSEQICCFGGFKFRLMGCPSKIWKFSQMPVTRMWSNHIEKEIGIIVRTYCPDFWKISYGLVTDNRGSFEQPFDLVFCRNFLLLESLN